MAADNIPVVKVTSLPRLFIDDEEFTGKTLTEIENRLTEKHFDPTNEQFQEAVKNWKGPIPYWWWDEIRDVDTDEIQQPGSDYCAEQMNRMEMNIFMLYYWLLSGGFTPGTGNKPGEPEGPEEPPKEDEDKWSKEELLEGLIQALGSLPTRNIVYEVQEVLTPSGWQLDEGTGLFLYKFKVSGLNGNERLHIQNNLNATKEDQLDYLQASLLIREVSQDGTVTLQALKPTQLEQDITIQVTQVQQYNDTYSIVLTALNNAISEGTLTKEDIERTLGFLPTSNKSEVQEINIDADKWVRSQNEQTPSTYFIPYDLSGGDNEEIYIKLAYGMNLSKEQHLAYLAARIDVKDATESGITLMSYSPPENIDLPLILIIERMEG